MQHGRRDFQQPEMSRRFLKVLRLLMALPGPLRRAFYAAVARSPHMHKKALGTVAMSAVGMFGGPGMGSVGGWGIPVSHHTLAVTLGGIGRRQILIDGCPQDREFLCVTVTVDHAIVDGAPAARFASRFRELLECAYALDAVA